MHPFFEPLSDREAMLLLTTLTVGGSNETGIFRHMGEAAGRLDAKAKELLGIAKDKRVPFMVAQIKQAISFKGLRGVEKVDPSWILQGMRGESPRVVAAILISMPPQTVRSVLKRLPPGIRKNLPPKDELKRVPVELVRAVRQIFESRFHAMPESMQGKTFGFKDLIHLERRELYRLMRDLGLVELGQAFVAVGKLALAELCRRLPRAKAEELILAVRSASQVDAPDLKSAQRFLSRVVVNFNDTEEFFHNAGLWRISKACLIEDMTFRQAFRQRMPRDAGELWMGFIDKASEMAELTPELSKRLQDTILLRAKDLSKRQILSARWAQLEITYHDPAFAAQFERDDSMARAPFADQMNAAASAAADAAEPPEDDAGGPAPLDDDDGEPPESA
jgi:hypothetical protein